MKALKEKYGDLPSATVLELSEGMSLQVDRLRETLERYASGPSDPEFIQGDEQHGPLGSSPSLLHQHLSLLFSPKQEELIIKRIKDESFTKTEREYYSRVVKKKLKAIANKVLQELATRLTSS